MSCNHNVGCGDFCHDVYCMDDTPHLCHICCCDEKPRSVPTPPKNISKYSGPPFWIGEVVIAACVAVVVVLLLIIFCSGNPS